LSAHNTTAERLLLLYVWNENDERGYLTPTRQDDTKYLQAVRCAMPTALSALETPGE